MKTTLPILQRLLPSLRRALPLAAALGLAVCAIHAQTYTGNGNAGFGGILGPQTITFTNDGTTLTGTSSIGALTAPNAVVLYLDADPGAGAFSTANYTDNADGGRRAASGIGSGGRATVTFPFGADYAIVFGQGFGVLFELVENGSHNFVANVGDPSSFSIALADIGSPTGGLDFVATLLNSDNGFRSDEAFGTGVSSGNPGVPSAITIGMAETVPLPVDLLRFDATARGGAVELTWATARERDNAGFHVERSADGAAWTEIGFVAARTGTESPELEYAYLDRAAPAGTSYYRLRQRDHGGATEYSEARSARVALAAAGLRPAPNPAVGYTTVANPRDRALDVALVGADGRVWRSLRLAAHAQARIPLGGLPAGTYVLRSDVTSERLLVR